MSEKQIMWDRLSWEYADRYLNFPPGISRLHRAALYWLEWNALSERHADYQFRIEDLNPRRMVQLLGVQDRMALPLSEVPEALHLRSSSLEQATNGRVNRTQLTWEALEEEVGAELTERIKKAAVRYGYSLDATR
uniref:Uncharacterized protein n=2 Tax=Rhizochromulina marina TaxID=1034831 RepID=A0A7S2WPR2_9STRA|mmetsp:Transcript_29580/g.86298  ORF Transcript_29580/g.86298 Transcript_29580/m.86298 type:complete len:135 (+) Transcript_29580:222-626(+)